MIESTIWELNGKLNFFIMNKKSISIFCAILMIIGTALPWTSMQATSSFFDSETSLSGLKFTEGILGLIAAIAGIGLVYFRFFSV